MAQQQKALLLLSKDAGKLTFGLRPIPKPGPGEVLIKNMAVALNPIDAYIEKAGVIVQHFPAVIGFDGAGVIEQLGEGVTGRSVGDRVFYQGGAKLSPDHTTFQEYTISDATRLGKIPANISFDEAASIPLCLSTAAIGLYEALATDPPAAPWEQGGGGGGGLTAPWLEGGRGKYTGQPLLVIGGSSSVGQFTLQLARLSGFSPIITTASARNADYCKAAGATHVIDYHDVPYAQLPAAVAKITSTPFALVVDAISAEADSKQAALEIVKPGGTLVIVRPPPPSADTEATKGKRIVLPYGSVHAPLHTAFGDRLYAALEGLMESGDFKPNEVEVLPGGLAGISDALVRFFTNGVSGVKLVARVPETP